MRSIEPGRALDLVRRRVDEHAETVAAVRGAAKRVVAAADLMVDCLGSEGTILACGNGGSAADAQHLAAELVGRFLRERRPLAAVALSTNSSIVTAVGNDYGFGEVFARQVVALGRTGDVLLAISTSGRSPNVLVAVEAARSRGLRTIALSGGDGGPLAACCDVAITVPAKETPRIQEAHILIVHLLCELVEAAC